MSALGVMQLGVVITLVQSDKSLFLAGVYACYAVSNFLMIGVAR